MSGSACGFSVRDSVFSYSLSPDLTLEDVPLAAVVEESPRRNAAVESVPYICLAGVCLATRDDSSWEVAFTTGLPGNRHTTTTLTVNEPLRAGTVRIIKAKMKPQGGLDPEDESEVGATVALDWKDGGDQDVEI
jgi:hypothetical protein